MRLVLNSSPNRVDGWESLQLEAKVQSVYAAITILAHEWKGLTSKKTHHVLD